MSVEQVLSLICPPDTLHKFRLPWMFDLDKITTILDDDLSLSEIWPLQIDTVINSELFDNSELWALVKSSSGILVSLKFVCSGKDYQRKMLLLAVSRSETKIHSYFCD